MSKRHALACTEIAKVGRTDELTLRKADIAGYAVHLGNFRAALEWSFSENGDRKIATKLARRCTHLFSSLSLFFECYQWAERGLASLADEDRGSREELFLRGALAAYAMFANRNVDVRQQIEEGVRLARNLADDQYELELLAALHLLLMRSGDFLGSLPIAERMKSVARSPAAHCRADCLLSASHHLIGDQRAALNFAERSRIASESLLREELVFYGHDIYLACRFVLARALWLSGFPTRATEIARAAIAEGERGNNPMYLCVGLVYCATVFIWNGDVDEAQTCLAKLLQHASRHSLTSYLMVGEALAGTVAIARGNVLTGLDEVRHAAAKLESAQYPLFSTSFHLTAAGALASSGEVDAAMATIDAAFKLAEERGGTFDLPNLHRVRGEIFLLKSSPDEAEGAFLRAVEAAQAQSALMLELKAAISLASLWASTDRARAAKDLLLNVYSRFTEGFETRELRDAQTLLTHLDLVLLSARDGL